MSLITIRVIQDKLTNAGNELQAKKDRMAELERLCAEADAELKSMEERQAEIQQAVLKGSPNLCRLEAKRLMNRPNFRTMKECKVKKTKSRSCLRQLFEVKHNVICRHLSLPRNKRICRNRKKPKMR